MTHAQLPVTLYSDAAYYGGAEVYLTTLARSLDRERIRLSALVPDDPPVPRLEEELASAGVAIARHHRPGFRWWEAIPRLRRSFEALGGEVLHINLPSTYDAGLSCVALAARLAGYRRVLTTEHLPMIQRRYRRFPGKVLFSEAVDLILVPAHATREYVVQLHRMPWEKTRIIPYGIDAPPPLAAGVEEEVRARTQTPRGMLTLGIVGRLTPRKGHRFLFEALSILGRRGALDPMRLWVIGEGEDAAELAREARERGLEETVRFLGLRSDAASLIRLLDLLVVPSLVETTPFVILEAMACGRPVVASRIYGIPEMIEEGGSGRLVPPGEPAALADVLDPLLRSAETRERMGRRARELYDERFSADRMARATEAGYFGRANGGGG
jgi:glycosyltransferase involved in cell wall biosynthesis